MPSEYSFRLATTADRPAIIAFMNTHWESRHPLINLPEFFDFYYNAPGGRLNFALAEQDGRFAALAGYIPASEGKQPDIWVSLWVAARQATGSGLELMAALPALTGCRTLACNNIRPKTRAFYEFLGFTTGQMGHFYRLAPRAEYLVARPAHRQILPVQGGAALVPYPAKEALLQSGFVPPQANPYKDFWYITRRYYAYPRQTYSVYGAVLPGQVIPFGLLVTRTVPVLGTFVLRIADYLGPPALLPRLGSAINGLLQAENAEYIDLYCAGLSAELLAQTGFTHRTAEDQSILPNYLTPPLFENTEYYYFTNRPENFTMFKADGDQDRPNLPPPPEE